MDSNELTIQVMTDPRLAEARLRGELRQLKERNATLEAENARLRSRIHDLERVNADLAEKARRLLGAALTSGND